MPKNVIQPLVATSILLLFACQNHGGFLALLVLPFFLIWLLVRAFTSFKNTNTFKSYLIASSIWITAFTIIAIAHWTRHVIIRRSANQIAQKIIIYKFKQGVFPKDLSQICTDSDKSDIAYQLINNEPILFYMSTFAPFSTYRYNFETKTWVFQGD